MCHKKRSTSLFIDDEKLFTGDEISIGVIYHNLTGTNFKDRPEDHKKYIQRMKDVSNIRFGNLSLKDQRGKIIKSQTIKI